MATPLHVLLIEETDDDTVLIQYHLKKAGFDLTLIRVETGEAMQSALKSNRWDIVISEYNLAKFSAPEALSILQQSQTDIPFIVVSGTINEEAAIEMMRSGAADYLMKERLMRLGALVRRELNIAQVRREREEAQKAMQESEFRFRTLVEQSPYGVLILDQETTLPLEFNSAAHLQLGYSRAEFAQMRISDYEAQETPEEIKNHIHKVLVQNRDDFETLHRTKQGETRMVQVTVQPIEFFGRNGMHAIYRDITEIKRKDEALRLSEEKFATAFRVSPDSININRLSDGMYIEINEGFTAMTGYTIEDVRGKNSLELNIWGNPLDRFKLVKGLEEGNQVVIIEAPFRTKAGKTIICQMSARIIEIDGEKCLLSITRDITDRKQAEESLRTSEQNFREIFNSTNEAIFIHDAKTGEILDVNESMLRIYGFASKGEIFTGEKIDFSANEPPYTEAHGREMVLRAIQEKPQIFEWLSKRKDGTKFWTEISLRKTQIGGQDKVLAVVRDISDRKKAEQAQFERESLYRVFFEQGPDGVVVLNPLTGQIVEFNDIACRQLGYGREEFSRMKVQDLEMNESPVEVSAHFKKVINDGQGDFETCLRTKQGEIRNVHVIAQVIELNGSPIYHCIWRDNTERKRSEAQLLKNQAALDRQNNLLNSLLKNLQVGVIMVEAPSGKPLVVNEEAHRLLGFNFFPDATRENLGQIEGIYKASTRKPYPPDEMPIFLSMQGSNAYVDDMLVVHPDGSECLLEIIGSPVTDHDGKVWASLVSFQDITERKRAEQKITEQLEELRRWHAITLGREKRILELKNEVNRLLIEAGKPPHYNSAQEQAHD